MKRKFKQRWSTIPPISTKTNNHLPFNEHKNDDIGRCNDTKIWRGYTG